MKRILVVCNTLDYFYSWGNTLLEWYNTTADRRKTNILEVSTAEGSARYIAYTPRMGKDSLRGCRFNKIIDLVGLSDEDKVFFDSLVEGEDESKITQ